MTVKIIQTDTDGTAFYRQTTPLDGRVYQLIFTWNARTENWYLTVRTEAGVEIEGCEGMKLVQGGFPLRKVADLNRPPGEIIVQSEFDAEPTLTSLGTDTVLAYIPRADLEELFD